MIGLLICLDKLQGKRNNQMSSLWCTWVWPRVIGQCDCIICLFSSHAATEKICLTAWSFDDFDITFWWPASSVSYVTNICICPGKVFCFSIFKPTSRPFSLLLLEEAAQSFSLSTLSLLADSGTSSTKKQLSTVAATTLGSVPSGASACPSWIHRLGLLRTTATSGWRRGTGDQVGSAVSVYACACTEGWPLSPHGV